MTNKEVKERLIVILNNNSFTKADKKALNLAIVSLEKRIPKKPYDVDTEYKTFDCPECLSKLYTDDDMQDCGYCPVCGQALDWSDIE